MERELIACYREGEEIKKTVEGRQPGQDSPLGLRRRRAPHVIGPRVVIFFQEQPSP